MSSSPLGEVLRVSNTLVGRIVSGAYSAGLRLPPEVSLAAELGCSRSTLREALRHLSSLGLVRSRRGSGVLVLDFRREGTLSLLPAFLSAGLVDPPLAAVARELLHMRGLLAAEAARLAAIYASAEALGPARELARKLPTLTKKPAEHSLCELELYRELLCASKMWPAVWFANAFWEPMRAIHQQIAPLVGVVDIDHAAMLRALFSRLERHEADRASELVRAHFHAVDQALLPELYRALGSPPAVAPGGSSAKKRVS